MNRRSLLAAATGLLLLAALSLPASGSATALAPFIDLQEKGLTLVDDDAGLEKLGSGTESLTVDVGGPVRFALLYWAGRDRPCPQSPPGTCTVPSQPYKDQQAVFNGTPIVGTIIGTEGQPATEGGATNNIAYVADVTSIVGAAGVGPKTFSFADGNLASNLFRLDGASLIVAYTDPVSTVTYRVVIWDGLDFAFANDPTPGPSRETTAVAMAHGAVPFARTGALTVLAGDATAAGADRLTISNNADVVGCLNGSGGARWDTDTLPIDVPTGTSSTNVRVTSESGANPDELLWTATVLRVPVDAPSVAVVNDCSSPPPPQPLAGLIVGPVDPAPELTQLSIRPKTFAAARSGGAIVSAVGATVRYTSSEPASVTFRVERVQRGALVKGACVKRRPSNSNRKRCRRYQPRPGHITHAAQAGPNSLRFSGRLNNRKLPAGPYRLVAVATDGADQRSDPAYARFAIEPPAPRKRR